MKTCRAEKQHLVSKEFWCIFFVSVLLVFGSDLFIMLLVQFVFLSGPILGNSCPLSLPFVHIVFCLLVIFVFPILIWDLAFY